MFLEKINDMAIKITDGRIPIDGFDDAYRELIIVEKISWLSAFIQSPRDDLGGAFLKGPASRSRRVILTRDVRDGLTGSSLKVL